MFFIIIIILIVLVFALGVRIVPQAHAYVVERLGKYSRTLDAGMNFIFPGIDYVARKVDLREQVVDFPPQSVITSDNVTISIDTVVYYQITNPQLYAYGVEDPLAALRNLTATTLRNVIGTLDLDTSLTSRDTINGRLRTVLDEATDKWGIKVNRVELQNIMPPKSIQDAMEKQMKAERERREKILRAEGEKQSTILVAEGQNQARVLEAKALKEAMIEEAEGKAEALKLEQEAYAKSLEMLSSVGITPEVLQLKSLEAFGKAADGKSTKIIIPSEIQSLAGLVEGLNAVKDVE